jgi:hypothetical protein
VEAADPHEPRAPPDPAMDAMLERSFTAASAKCRTAMACVRLGDTLANAMGTLRRARPGSRGRPASSRTSPIAWSRGGWRWRPWDATSPTRPCCWRPPNWRSTGPAASGTSNLETKALADAGLAHVRAGRVAEGMALLDEAMALACGPCANERSRFKERSR